MVLQVSAVRQIRAKRVTCYPRGAKPDGSGLA